MADRVRSAPSTARYGLTDDRAAEHLRAAGWWGEGGPAPDREASMIALSRTADPDLALFAVDRIRTADVDGWPAVDRAIATDRGLRGRLLAVFGGSTALADFVIPRQGEWRRLLTDRQHSVADYADVLLGAVGAERAGAARSGPHPVAGLAKPEATRALRAAYRGLLLEIAADDLGHVVERDLPVSSYAQTTHRLTALAEAAIRAALAVAAADVGEARDNCRLAVIAMGKCGGHELNYVSDVDVLFIGDGDVDTATRMASTMLRVAGQACFEVDAALRPEGKAGPLVRTLDGHAAYYQRWARTWEFQALLKARPIAGDAALGEDYLDVVQPLVWSAADRDNFVDDVRSMRRRVEDHVPAELIDRELKLGRGGLRDVEFAVQLLQLVHGRNDESLRRRSTVDSLAALGDGGYVGRADAAELGESYRFLRMLEHRLQLQKLRRTHTFPDAGDTDELRRLARAAGIKPDRGKSEGDVLQSEFHRHLRLVRRLHEKLFYRPLLEAVARVPGEALRLSPQSAEARLAALGYAAPDGALRHIESLTAGVSRRAAIQRALLPALLEMLAETPDPDGGLLAYRRVSEALAATDWYLRVLRDEAAVVERLATLLGTSKLVPDLIVRAPEVLRLLGDPEQLAGRDTAEVATSLRQAVNRQGYLGNAVAAARSGRRHELLRVASADLLGFMDVLTVCHALSSVWSAVLQATLAAVDRAEAVSAGGHRATIAVIGMGRLGGAELGYGSDADVLFVCEPAEGVSDSDAVKYASRVAQTVRKLLGAPSQDPPLQVDVDLRPEGRQGPIVRTLESYRAYYDQWSQVWEAQALLRARPIAGDEDLGARFIEMIDPLRYPQGGLDAERVREIRRIKARVDTERLPRGADPATHAKLGRGGLADVEWTLQLLQLRHAHGVPSLRTTSTVDGLGAAVEAGLVDEIDATALREAWLLATRVRNAITVVRGKITDQLPSSGRDLAAVAAVLRPDAEPGEFLDSYRRTLRRARGVVERLFYED
ncbi:MAG: bifunctional [glutamine synthetase] adenylyltransferase/[glutamine synthetase]-adenylyl-L-tyrosine phosphorylase [Actinophytocola sp.]|uniref:bifunctional [glutamine synthetase] adenylyltransferase/[glutamine synthetase]-adenylyl-L-tyrosine phosphorylase n=1 Tax=Actinophytocola sp. TaxID=1872138 RepID=UPI00132AB7FD|nr:bifunctional [glutamine synthetase] adenylyltransferase/[glutamine synthetase]-adenylyl-L-tyrosine phosphorylase [Actinophytocola sp.]MPZ81637.1 bifunctional [glutamine synthetase] adenylyltransferase/[glutamine synthetase]-adenylyl-L-tyrosine phosphorylase [Actinophytocola sp.]